MVQKLYDYVNLGYFNSANRDRLTLYSALHPRSKYTFFYNISSPRDKIQAKRLFKTLKLKFPDKSGYYHKKNVHIFILKTRKRSSHILFPDQNMCKFFEYTMHKGPIKITNSTFLCFADYLELTYKYNTEKEKQSDVAS